MRHVELKEKLTTPPAEAIVLLASHHTKLSSCQMDPTQGNNTDHKWFGVEHSE